MRFKAEMIVFLHLTHIPLKHIILSPNQLSLTDTALLIVELAAVIGL